VNIAVKDLPILYQIYSIKSKKQKPQTNVVGFYKWLKAYREISLWLYGVGLVVGVGDREKELFELAIVDSRESSLACSS
jgi:hypothetical protein